ncbi:hypothetical protein BU23DRAFT_651749 [Bimuria novae-zelandiae CBS 107.79]|uniref:Uncharacterized protein n=1 Tax=Bimuria novae-zelandiae CBS 107.79 TaxID=1447943 RepID=A0A6A5UYP6_9PLEO|nr:hypothetical protein BU23DRAFT_651749 [Bimuria novae-zelandiae CBS 107.79]
MRGLYTYIVITLASCCAVQGECYYPDGTVAPGLVPCNEGAEVSHCCRDADTCLTNGLCFSSGLGSILRRGCTDKGWNQTECPNICNGRLSTHYYSLQSDATLLPCGEYGTFCCGQDDGARACCESGNGTVKVGGGEAMCNGTTTIFVTALASTSTSTAGTSTTSPTDIPTCSAAELKLSDVRSRETAKQNAMIALAALFGCTAIAFAMTAVLWRRERRQLLDRLLWYPAKVVSVETKPYVYVSRRNATAPLTLSPDTTVERARNAVASIPPIPESVINARNR